MRPDPKACKAGTRFVRERVGNTALAPFTGQDRRAFEAFLHLLELYAVADEPGQVAAERALVWTLAAMQPSCWPIATAAIPWALDWDKEATFGAILTAKAKAFKEQQLG